MFEVDVKKLMDRGQMEDGLVQFKVWILNNLNVINKLMHIILYRDVALYLRKYNTPGCGRGFPDRVCEALNSVPIDHV